MSLKIRPLEKEDHKELFDCGTQELNRYLQQTARQHIDKDIARTFVLVKEDTPQIIIGYYTLVLVGINPLILPDKLSKKYPKNNYIPAIKLARLAVANEYKGSGYGKFLVVNAIKRVLKNYIDLGIHAIFVDPKSYEVIPFYDKFGFSLLSDGITMYLPLRNLVDKFVAYFSNSASAILSSTFLVSIQFILPSAIAGNICCSAIFLNSCAIITAVFRSVVLSDLLASFFFKIWRIFVGNTT